MAASKAAQGTGFDKAVDRVRDNVKDFVSNAGETAAETIGAAADYGADGVKAAARTVPQATAWADGHVDQAREAIREKPIKMMAIAAGVGALVGMFFLRR